MLLEKKTMQLWNVNFVYGVLYLDMKFVLNFGHMTVCYLNELPLDYILDTDQTLTNGATEILRKLNNSETNF